jgi:hypothetical protein
MDESLFSRLPAELRIRIYEYALTFDRVSCRLRESSRFWPERSLAHQLALTQVCEQLQAECQHLPFTLNRLVVGEIPLQLPYSNIPELHRLADQIAQNIASTPSDLMSKSTILSLDLGPQAKDLFRYGLTSRSTDASMTNMWVAIKLLFGKLMRTTQKHKFVFDVTPGGEKYGIHLWCEAGDHDPASTSFESRYELLPELAIPDSDSGHYAFAATFDCALVIVTANRHRDHNQSLCNVTKHGDKLLAEVARLERCAATIIGLRIEDCNSCNSPRV